MLSTSSHGVSHSAQTEDSLAHDASAPTRLSQALRERTEQAHRDAESSPFVSELLSGQRTQADYAALAAQQYFVYQALEAVLEQLAEHTWVAAIHSTELNRVAAIEADLEFLYGKEWRFKTEALPATADYVSRILGTRERPEALVAHHYTRYLGDLSGGQIIRTLMQRQFGFNEDGVRFYHFAQIPKPKVYKDQYRQALDSLQLDQQQHQALIDEANVAFEMNANMFAGLAAASTVR